MKNILLDGTLYAAIIGLVLKFFEYYNPTAKLERRKSEIEIEILKEQLEELKLSNKEKRASLEQN
ncbi:hypothetical protein [Dolosicoccus paucivorans]|uniref:hypothetical protein n=1 Tax=Dolosicoccus paucivorans TaxID=84521 RepID=UPI000891E3CF|nr:hypothetical protein [Dolosicoccus paucivorans]SDI41609.1 hypothetical protein SAMN04487994_101056 [Dolosicoccus paucivorans]